MGRRLGVFRGPGRVFARKSHKSGWLFHAVSAYLALVAEPAGAWEGGVRPPGLAGDCMGWEVKIVCIVSGCRPFCLCAELNVTAGGRCLR